MSKKALGKGLSALIQEATPETTQGDAASVTSGTGVSRIPIELIQPSDEQPRKAFAQERLEELSRSIREKGVIQPIIVEKAAGKYRVVAGERRLHAAKLAGLEEMPAIVGEYTEQERLEISLVENIQREDLNPMEEAAAIRVLLDRSGLSQEALSNRLGKNRAT